MKVTSSAPPLVASSLALAAFSVSITFILSRWHPIFALFLMSWWSIRFAVSFATSAAYITIFNTVLCYTFPFALIFLVAFEPGR